MSHLTNQTADESRGIVGLTESERHSLLAAKRRRILLDILPAKLSTFELRELSGMVATREGGYDESSEDDIEEIAITLHHVHLPKMDECGVVAYDRRRGQVTSTRVISTL